MNLSAFKAYDIRGKYPDEINEKLAYLTGRSIAKYFSAKTIVVGRDMRLSSPSLTLALIDGITSEGSDVIDIGMVTTPMLNFAVANYSFDGGVMVSASHNPGGDNAFKIIDRDVIQLDESSGLNNLKQLVQSKMDGKTLSRGKVINKDILSDYCNHIVKKIGPIGDLKIVADYGNGVGAISAKPVFEQLGLDVINIFDKPDGGFPNHPANPHDICNFSQLVSKVVSEKADLGLFFDGDADRVNFVDDTGRVVPTDLMVVLLARAELSSKKSGNIYYDLRFSKAVKKLISDAGGEPVMMRVGNPFYKRVLKEKGGVLGAEFAGHIMYPDNNNIDDGLFAALKAIKMITQSKQKLSALIDSVNLYSTSPEESLRAKHPYTVHERLLAAFPGAKSITLDGTYLDFDDGFISVRQSQNERQLFRIRVEANTIKDMISRFNKVKSIVSKG